jgi:hypothetical protein
MDYESSFRQLPSLVRFVLSVLCLFFASFSLFFYLRGSLLFSELFGPRLVSPWWFALVELGQS